MIFKTFINDLRNVQSIINSISNVEVWANGATGLLNANSLNSLKTAISGLSKEQALLVLSTKNLSKAQAEQVLSAAGLLNVEKQLTTAQLSERLAKELNSKADAEALLINSGLITQKELEENATIKVTAAKINEAVANGTLSASDAGVIAGTLGMTGVNTGATISFDLLTASIWANIKALGAWLVTNPIGWAILGGTAIFGLVKAYDALTDSVEEVKERTDSLLETYNSAISEANSNAQTIESLASRYEKLSKGVNNLGENVSLTAEEYSEYNDIVNQIADMFPTMITGYTDEGNAILSLKGNVEELRDAYKEAQKEAYNLLIVSGKDNDGNDIITNYQNQVNGNESWLSKQSSYIDGEAGAKDAIEIITRLTGALTPDEFRETYNQLYEEYKNIWNSDKIQEALKSSGFEELTHAPNWSEITAEDLAKVKYSAQATIQTYNAEIDSQLKNMQTLANAYLMTNSDYEKLDEQSKTAASLLVNSINENIADKFSSKEDVGAYVGELVTSISGNKEVQYALKELFTMDTSDMSVDEINKQTDSYINTIAEVLKEDPIELKARLGFDDTDTQPLINNVKEKLQDDFDDKVGELTLDELHIAAEQVEVPEGTLLSWNELIAKIKEVQSSTLNSDPSTSTSISENISDLKDLNNELDKLGSAIANIDENGKFELSDLDSIADYFLGLEDIPYNIEAVNDSLKVLGSEDSTLEEQTDAINTLADQYLKTSGILDDLTTENAELIKLQLQRMGITNAEEIVNATLNGTLQSQAEIESILAQNKSIVTGETLTLANVTAEEIQILIAEGKITNETANQMAILAIKKQLVNGNTLNTSADINNLISLCQMLGATTTALERYNQVKNGANGMPSNVVDGYKKAAEKELQDAIKTGQASLNATYTSVPKAIYNGGANVAKALDDANKSAQSSAKETKDTYEELFDFFERRIDVLNNALELLNANLENVIGSNGKNQLIDAQIGINKESINNYTDALAMYQSKASEALSKIPADFQDKIVNGAVALTDFIGSGNEDLVEAIKEYQKWADKVSDCQQELAKLKETIRQLELDKFNNIIEDFTNQFDISSNAQDLINKQIDLFKEAGELIGKGFYEGLIKESEGQLSILQQEKTKLVEQLNSAIDSGRVNCCPAT